MKKILSLILAGMLLTAPCIVEAQNFADVPTGTEVEEAVELLTALNVAKGVSDTEFDIDGEVTRQQMAAFMYRIMKAGKSVVDGENTTSFTDLVDPYYNFMISWASAQGVIKGRTANTFDPTGNIILQDAYTMAVRALGYDKGNLTYPIGYISLAEDLGLNENLPASLKYTDVLTRGDVAIILANMFYAETADVEVKYEATWKEVELSNGTLDVVSTGQIPVEYHKTVAEKIFGVEKVVQRVVATPTYTFNGEDRPDEDVEMIVLKGENYVLDYKEDYTIPNLEMVEFAELGLPGDADDYFLSDIEMFVRENDGEYEIFSAIAKGTNTTVDFSDITFGTVSGSTSEKYYDGEEKEHKKINGLMNIDGVKTYIFDVPYSYSKDAENSEAHAAKFITLDEYDGDLEEDEIYFNYVKKIDILADENIVWDNGYLEQMYHNGLGEVDCYDCNGDGKYEYLFVKNYCVMEVDDTEDMSLIDDYMDDYILYIDKTFVEGAKIKDEDIVVGYINPCANFAIINKVLKPVEAEVSVSATKYFTLTNGAKVYYKDMEYAVENGVSLGEEDAVFDVEKIYYFAGNKLVKVEGEDTAINLAEKWIIVLEAEPHTATVMIDGKLQRDYYVDAIVDGEIVSLKVANSDYSEYVNKLAVKDKIDKKGRYSFELLEAVADDLTTDDKTAELHVLNTEAEFYHKTGNIYNLTGTKGVNIKPYTQIIIKSLDKDGEVVVNTYDSKNLPDIKENTVFTDVSYVLVNNVNSKNYENLAVFYGVLEDVIKPAKNTTNDIRIVKEYTKTSTEDEIKYIYTLYNPATGEVEENVEGYDETSIADIGDIVQLTAAGEVDIVVGNIDVAGNVYIDEDSTIGYLTVSEYDNGLLGLVDDETIYNITDETVISVIDISDEEITITDTDALDPTRKSSWYDKDNDVKDIRVIVSAEENKDEEYDVIYITIIRK